MSFVVFGELVLKQQISSILQVQFSSGGRFYSHAISAVSMKTFLSEGGWGELCSECN